MAQYNHLPVFQHTYRLNLEIYQAVHQFPKEYKYTLGNIIKNLSSEILNGIVAANSANEKREILESAKLKLEQFRIHLRLSADLKILGLNRYEMINRMVEEISKELTGWCGWSKCPQTAAPVAPKVIENRRT